MAKDGVFSFIKNPFKKQREYPIIKDESGRSIRQRCFQLFDSGKRPEQVSRKLDVSFRTAYRYFPDWKKLPRFRNIRYQVLKTVRNNSGPRDKLVEMFAGHYGMPKDEVIKRLQKPWGLKQFLMGRWLYYWDIEKPSKQDVRHKVALDIIDAVDQGRLPHESLSLCDNVAGEQAETLQKVR